MNYHGKFIPPQPVVFRDPPDVQLCKLTITALLHENALLKDRLTLHLAEPDMAKRRPLNAKSKPDSETDR